MSSPKRSEVWLVDLGYVAKVRPCLVISIPALYQEIDVWFEPFTNQTQETLPLGLLGKMAKTPKTCR